MSDPVSKEQDALDSSQDPLLSDEEEQLRHIPPRPRRAPSAFWRIAQPVCFFLLGVASTAGFLSYRPETLPTSSHSACPTDMPILASQVMKTPLPELPFEIRTFQPNETFQSRESFEASVAWNSLLPPGRGFVYVEDPEQYNLLPGEETDYGPIYSTSMFHQIHCLAQIRHAWESMASSFEQNDVRHGLYLIETTAHHVHHCLDYLRQAVQCSGDLSLEWPQQEGEGKGFAVDGWGVPHVCRSWQGIMDFMESKHANQSLNINAVGK